MSNWNGKLLCIKEKKSNCKFTKGKTYEVKNGIFYEDGGYPIIKDSFEHLILENPPWVDHLVEIDETNSKEIKQKEQNPPTKEPDWNIEQSKSAMYIMINETVTIAIPKGTPIGISFKHPDDEYNEEIGQALALKRLLEY